MQRDYDFKGIEERWRKRWIAEKAWSASDKPEGEKR